MQYFSFLCASTEQSESQTMKQFLVALLHSYIFLTTHDFSSLSIYLLIKQTGSGNRPKFIPKTEVTENAHWLNSDVVKGEKADCLFLGFLGFFPYFQDFVDFHKILEFMRDFRYFHEISRIFTGFQGLLQDFWRTSEILHRTV